MIIKGKSRGGPKQLATYLLRADTRERVELLELQSSAGTLAGVSGSTDLVRVGNITATVVEDLPTNVEFDRCWLHGALAGETRNAINANGRNIIVRDSYISEIKTSIVENHAFVSYNSPGPFTLVNNYIEASAIPILFGGATPAIRTPMLPSGLDMRFNYITKPLKWYRNSPYYEGKQYANKNMLEWKVGGASVVRWNVFEHNFREQRNDQSGAAIAFNVRLPYAQAGEWARTEDIQFTNNIVRRSHSAWSLLGADSNYKFTGLTQRITIRNNLFQEIGKTWDYRDGREYYTTFGRLIAGGRDIVVENNTFHSSEPLNAPGGPGSGLIFDGTSSPKTTEPYSMPPSSTVQITTHLTATAASIPPMGPKANGVSNSNIFSSS